MAYPTAGTPATSVFATTAASFAVNMPTTVSAGNLLIALVSSRNAATWTPPTGWTALFSQAGGSAVGQLSAFYKYAAGTEGGTTLTWGASATTTAAWQVVAISGSDGVSAPVYSLASGDSTTNPNSPALSPAWGLNTTLWLAVVGDAATGSAFTAAPSGFSGFTNVGLAAGGADAELATATLQSSVASKTPGLWGYGSNRFWAAATIGIVPAGPHLVQTSAALTGQTASYSKTLTSAVTSGNLVVVAIVAGTQSAPGTNITDNKGNTYRKLVSQGIGFAWVEFYYAYNVVGGSSFAITVSNPNVWGITGYAREYSGILSTANPLDQYAVASGGSANFSVGPTGTTTNANDLIIAAFGDDWEATSTYTVGTGYGNLISVVNGSAGDLAMEDKIVSTTGTQTATLTDNNTPSWIGVVAAFEAAPSTGTTYVNETMAASPATGTVAFGGGAVYGWQTGGWYQFNNNVNQWSDLYWTGTLPTAFTASADFKMGTTSGADGAWFYYGASTSPQTEGDAIGGYLINRNDFGNSIEIRFNGSVLTSVSYTKDTNWDTLSVAVSGQTFTISYQGTTVLTYTDPTTRTLGGSQYGWGARSGGIANTHTIRNLLVASGTGSGGSGGGGTPPPTYPGQFFAFF